MTTDPLISPADLARRLESVRVCDVRWYLGEPARGRIEYTRAHVPGAVFVDLDTDLSAPPTEGRHPLPDPGTFGATLGRLGIDPDTPVVAYDDAGGAIAARLWWMLRAFGHRRIQVLDGGWTGWIRAGHPVTETVPGPTGVDPYPAPDRWPGVVGRDEVVAALGSAALIDARAPERYRGEIEPVDARAGHIPGAVNLPHAGNLDPNGHHLDASSLAARFADVPPDPIVYCGSGVTACHDLLAMAVAGREDGLLYPGSWSDWAAHDRLPIEP